MTEEQLDRLLDDRLDRRLEDKLDRRLDLRLEKKRAAEECLPRLRVEHTTMRGG